MEKSAFSGEYNNTLDEKGRIMFPVKLRCLLHDSQLVITRGVDRCLWIFPPDEWTLLSEKVMQSASLFQANSRLVLRRLIAPAQEIEIDKAGRISIPQSLREYAQLEKDCVLLGINRYLELWNAGEYRSYLEGSEADFYQASEELGIIRF
ncbi:division/cell wall cluster transcriptional repressor MraZ [uncultured Campylobacter sp.]|uniref:division/cell wall cluster transcriptional repressor MraZ n=1 Tax=uncultured Campylobacter sp. TaxID=218934 RepID=UPI00260AC23C|nr:division/cell wall cluster transcriptional repressor MraZ [uncultured Campylobacter sp.]